MHDRKIWVLVVEDEKTSRKMVANQLHDNGFEVICAENGEVAWKLSDTAHQIAYSLTC